MRDLRPRWCFKSGSSSGIGKSDEEFYKQEDERMAEMLKEGLPDGEDRKQLDVYTYLYSLESLKNMLRTIVEIDSPEGLTEDDGWWLIRYSDGKEQTLDMESTWDGYPNIRWNKIVGIGTENAYEYSIAGRGIVFHNDIKEWGPEYSDYRDHEVRWRVDSARDYPVEAKQQNAYRRRERRKK